jgi:hypothetical protein
MNRHLLVICATSLASGCAAPPQPTSTRLFTTLKKDDFSALRVAYESRRQQAIRATSDQRADAAQAEQEARKNLTEAQTASLDEKFTRVMSDCNTVISGMSAKIESQERNSFLLSMSGLVAGAVLAPAATAADAAANKAFIAAASGWSGATNLASQTLRTTGLAGDAVATSRNAIVTKLDKAIGEATSTEGCSENADACYDRRFAAIQSAQGACIAYAVTIPGAVPPIPTTPSTEK